MAFLVLAGLGVSGWGQETESKEAAVPASEEGAAVPASEEGAAVPAADLFSQTLAKDIQAATYYELVTWCRELGLEDSGGRQALQQRVAGHYKIRLRPVSAAAEARIEIVSARQIEYFTLEEVGEEYVVLRGDVVVRIRDREENATHVIDAQEIVYNQSRHLITASGGARYIIERATGEEVFEGESVHFDTETFEGVFYQGKLEKERQIQGRTLNFVFRGTAISRLSNDMVVLDEGRITSSEAPDPNYHIRARKVWILDEGEWALSHGVLYVGRLPVLYIPFFFFPGDEFVFHPSLGYREREGNFLQTTTYLIGQRRQEDDPLDFLRISDTSSEDYQKARWGLFLRTDETNRIPVESSTRYLKLLADVYSRLGGFVGLEGSFPPRASFSLGLGVSRSIFSDAATGGYTPYWYDETDRYVSVWNTARILGATVPFRYGGEARVRLGTGAYGVTGVFELYSDPYFTADFHNRSEQMQWDQLLEPASTSAAAKTNLVWSLGTSLNFSRAIATPLVQELSLKYLDGTAQIRSRVATDTDLPAAADPARGFYYPQNLRFPNVSASMRGTLLRLPQPSGSTRESGRAGAPGGDAPPPRNPGAGFRSPLDEPQGPQEVEESPEGASDREIPLPGVKSNLGVNPPGTTSTMSMTYAVSPSLTMEFPFASEGWTSPESVDFGLSHVGLSTLGSARLQMQASLWNRLLTLSSELSGLASYRTRYPGSVDLDEEQWLAQILPDHNATRITVDQRSSLTFSPLESLASLASSSVSYTLGLRLLAYTFDGMEGDNPVYVAVGPAFTTENVTAHNAALNLRLRRETGSGGLSLSAELPPRDLRFRGNLTATVWRSTTRALAGLKLVDAVWEWDPFTLTETLQLLDRLSLQQELQVDLGEVEFTRSSTTVQAYGAVAGFTAARIAPVDPLGTPTGDPVTFLPSRLNLGYTLPTAKTRFWKNRIAVEGSLRTSWSWNLQTYTQNRLVLNLTASLSIYRFLTVSFSAESYNNRMYLYIPGYPQGLPDPEPWVNPIVDLFRSFNFFNITDRYASSFKVRRLSFSAVHTMGDWDLRVDYHGLPKVKDQPNGTRQYEWDSTLSLLLQWKPVSLIKTQARADEEGLHIRG